jgi:hypothetical protein
MRASQKSKRKKAKANRALAYVSSTLAMATGLPISCDQTPVNSLCAAMWRPTTTPAALPGM